MKLANYKLVDDYELNLALQELNYNGFFPKSLFKDINLYYFSKYFLKNMDEFEAYLAENKKDPEPYLDFFQSLNISLKDKSPFANQLWWFI